MLFVHEIMYEAGEKIDENNGEKGEYYRLRSYTAPAENVQHKQGYGEDNNKMHYP